MPKLIFRSAISALLFIPMLLNAGINISGNVIDLSTESPLAGADVFLEGTAIGDATDLNGHFLITNVSKGSYVLKIRFLGYESSSIDIVVNENDDLDFKIKLKQKVLEVETVTITAQALGQASAINQQISSNSIKSIVSGEKIMELPDANAAESVGRLPGISLRRSGGEGSQVVIRGLAPTYNSVTISGQKLAATDLDDRGVDLSMISPEILAGIEVSKALTPDQDADSFGGSVNFKLADAPSGGFRSNFRAQTGNNYLREDGGSYKTSLTLTNRLFDEKLGYMLTSSLEKAQRGSDVYGASYYLLREARDDEEYAPISINHLNLKYIEETRRRFSIGLINDVNINNSKITLNNFYSRLNRYEDIYTNKYDNWNNWHERSLLDRDISIGIITNSLAGEHILKSGLINWKIANSSSLNRHPMTKEFRVQEQSAFLQSLLPNEVVEAEDLIIAANNDIDETFLYQGEVYEELSKEDDFSARLDYTYSFAVGNNLALNIKVGTKYTKKNKDRKSEDSDARLDKPNIEFETNHTEYGNEDFNFQWFNGQPSIFNYLDEGFVANNFLDGEYDFGLRLDEKELNHLLSNYLLDSLYNRSIDAMLNDFNVSEQISSFYMMSEINYGKTIMFLPGFRYESTKADLTGRKNAVAINEDGISYPTVADTNAIANYENIFPMFHLKYRPLKWFDIRFAYTQSIARPQLKFMVPKYKVSASSNTITLGRPDLKPQISDNYDIFLSFYGNKLGLLTFGYFKKNIKDLIFERAGHKIIDAEAEGYPQEWQGSILDQAENSPFKTDVNGYEVEWQTRSWWLPKPLDGFILNFNYSKIYSKTTYPRSFVVNNQIPTFPFIEISVIDTFRTGPMPFQSDDIANLSIGYEREKFSSRVSVIYQGKTLSNIGVRKEIDGFTDDLTRIDFTLNYKINDKISFFINCSNITNQPDKSYRYESLFPTDIEYYGLTANTGFSIKN
tara:strand:+ start:681 stop:3566 length:2886 start_codon:yes stop_codon:yes gene_type:complete